MMDDFRKLVGDGRVTGLIYYSWIGEARFDVYRCGGLTQGGRLANGPLQGPSTGRAYVGPDRVKARTHAQRPDQHAWGFIRRSR
jgi:hypothetical protein